MSNFCSRLLVKLLLLYSASEIVGTTIGQADWAQSMLHDQGLYNSSDHVVVLNFTNIKSTVYGSRRGWLVEFYNSWCGFCQRYAPTWKALAHNIQTWRDIVSVGAINCADDDNNPLCREFEIMHYPEVRYFAPNENSPYLGVNVDKGKDMDELRQNLITRLRREQQEGRGSKWPNITPFRSSDIKNSWDGVPETAKYFFFLFEETKSFLGAEITLDFHNVTSLAIRSVTSDNNFLCLMYKITKFPSLVVYARDDTQKHLNLRIPTRASTRNVIKEFMSSNGIEIKILDIADEHPGDWIKTDISGNPINAEKPIDRVKTNVTRKNFIDDTLHQGDLEATLRFSIGHEIPMIKIIDGERMRALKNYTTVLASYFPMKHGNPMFLNTLSFVIRSKESISGEDFASLVTSTEEEMSPVYAEKNDWIACKASKIGLAGYPCGLWTLFHMLTVNFASKMREHPDMEVTQIFGAIHGYVKNFFGCADCARHFTEMAARNKMFSITSANEGVLWLWRAHNEVNERLAGADDPEGEKIQYPSSVHCPECRDVNGNWNETVVLGYLTKKYSNPVVSYNGSTRSSSFLDNERTKQRDERLATIIKPTRKFGWDFTIFDISICVVLYMASAAILILVCVKFAVKRSRKRKMYIHSIVGKV